MMSLNQYIKENSVVIKMPSDEEIKSFDASSLAHWLISQGIKVGEHKLSNNINNDDYIKLYGDMGEGTYTLKVSETPTGKSRVCIIVDNPKYGRLSLMAFKDKCNFDFKKKFIELIYKYIQ